jgi:ring-1,2-phenylacetyl-CoA epoxidase subunit PaaE
VPGGKASTYLTEKLQVGDTLWTTPPAGHFCLPESITAKKIVFFAAGSGITPIYSLIKSTLKLHPQAECILIYQNKNSENTIYLSELNQLAQTHAQLFKLELIFSSPIGDWHGLRGRLNSQQIEDLFLKYGIGIQSLHFMCGPDAFMNTVSETLIKMNLPKERIFRESFTAGAPTSSAANENTSPKTEFTIDDSCIVIGDKSELAECKEIEVSLDGENKTVPYLKDSTVLESLIEAGMNPPYSCMDGACMACIAKVESGSVYQNDLGILTDDNVEAKECLTCQARPASKKVKINFSVF